MISEGQEVAVIENTATAVLSLFEAENLSLLSRRTVALNTGFTPGPIFGASLAATQFYFAFNNIQPANYTISPAVYDFNTDERMVFDVTDIATAVEDELQGRIAITQLYFDVVQQIYFIGYAQLDTISSGGVLQINIDGELIGNLALPFVPTNFIVN